MIISDFGKRVRSLHTQQGMSQEKFALLIGMDRSYLASVESGKRNISLDNVYKIASGFDISLERFRFHFVCHAERSEMTFQRRGERSQKTKRKHSRTTI